MGKDVKVLEVQKGCNVVMWGGCNVMWGGCNVMMWEGCNVMR